MISIHKALLQASNENKQKRSVLGPGLILGTEYELKSREHSYFNPSKKIVVPVPVIRTRFFRQELTDETPDPSPFLKFFYD